MIGLYRSSALRTGDRPQLPEPGPTRVHGSTRFIEVRSAVGSGRATDETAELLFARVADDLPLLCDTFGVNHPLSAPLPVVLIEMPRGMPAARHDGTIYCDLAADAGESPTRALYTCHLLATQLAQLVAERAGPHWSAGTAHGRALSLALAGSLYPRWRRGWTTTDDWLASDRPDLVNVAGDAADPAAVGCATLFLDHLHHDLDLPWRAIARSGGPTLAITYRRSCGALDDPFPAFAAAVRDLAPADPAPAGAGPAVVDRDAPPERGRVAEPGDAVQGPLHRMLAHRWWWVVDSPVRHLRAEEVFTAAVYDGIVDTFRERKERGDLTRSLAGYDASAAAVTPADAGGFAVFLTQEWHDTIASLLGVEATGDVIATLHHHAPGSSSGTLHNDLNPGWFPKRDTAPGGGRRAVCIHDPAVNNYRTGHSHTGVETVERTRAIALLYYLDTPQEIIGGGTGFYRSARQPVDQPDVVVPPKNNSLVAFECTPFSFHTFLSNLSHERNCLVMWLHRDRSDADARWGTGSVVGWA